MEFRFTEDEVAFRKELREFLKTEIPPEWNEPQPDIYAEGALEAQIRRKLGEKGWRTMAWPKEYGGQGASFMKQLIYKEEIVYNDAKRMDDQGVDFIGPSIILHGTEEQKKYHLTRIASGEEWWCQGYSEPEAGSDLASLQTRAVEDGDDYVINGQKIWTSYAHLANWMHILTRTDTDASKPKHRGITYFLLDMKTPGITIRPLITMAGHHHFNEVFFDNVRVPKSNMLGELNRGWYVAMSTLDFERSGVEFPAEARRVLEQIVEYAREAKHNGRALIEDQVVSAKLAERAIEIEVSRLLSYRIAWMQGQDLVPNAEASIGKLFGSEISQRLADTVMQVLGLSSQLVEGSKWAAIRGKIEAYYLNTIATTIYSGTSEIQRNIIATRGLGLPRGG
ncbi:MAG: acyl-CoA dehydrogenase family protein [Dehalococcoidia bacterium]